MTSIGDLGSAKASPGEVPIDHLDYQYINQCDNVKELEKILKVLRSGKEGRWVDLEKHCENKIRTINPKSKMLRVTTELLRPSAMDENTRGEVNQDINDWLENMQQTDTQLKNSKNLASATIPPLRQSGQVHTAPQSQVNGHSEPQKKKNSERLSAYDYRAWDKYNPDDEVKKLDDKDKPKPEPKPEPSKKIPQSGFNPGVYSDPVEKKLGADREKDKGNECFKSGDYQESIMYYSNSILIQPSPATYNNRGLAELRLERYLKAIEDFDTVLELEPDNVKALLRRADASEKIGNIKEAHSDLKRSVIVDENNQRAQQLLEEFAERHSKLLTKGGKRMKIIESDSEDEENKENIITEQVVVTEQNKPCQKDESSSPPLNPPPSNPPIADTTTSDPTTTNPTPTAVPAPAPKPRNVIEILPLPKKVEIMKKEAGVTYSSGSYGTAVEQYTNCIKALDTKLPGHAYNHALLLSNRAACKLKTGACTECIKDCNESLAINPRWYKSVLRRAIAYETIENHKKAYEDYRLTVVMDPSQLTAQQGVSRVGELLKQKYGMRWREQVSPHAALPSGPEFIEQGSCNKPLQSTSVQHSVQRSTPKQEEPKVLKTAPSPQPKEQPTPKETPKPKDAPKPKETPKSKEVPKSKEAPKPSSQPTGGPANNRMPTKEEQYTKFKDQGNVYVAKQQYREALRCYEKCITLNGELLPAHLNSALCQLKLGNHNAAVKNTERVLSLDPSNIKALYRRATAYKELEKYSSSAKDLKVLLDKDPSNKQAEQLLDQVKLLWNNQLRGIKTPPSQPTKAQKPTKSKQPAKKGKKINIVAEDEEEKTSVPKSAEPQKSKPTEVQDIPVPTEPKDSFKSEQTKVGTKSNKDKPWMKKNNTGSLSGLTETTTAFSFLQHWSSYKKKKDIIAFAKVLESCEPVSFPKIFSSSLDADMVIAIVDAVDKYFVPEALHQTAIEVLQAVTKVQRFDVMTMLMGVSDKTRIGNVIGKLQGDTETITQLRKRFTS